MRLMLSHMTVSGVTHHTPPTNSNDLTFLVLHCTIIGHH